MKGLAPAAAGGAVGGVDLCALADLHGTPCYVYDAALIREQAAQVRDTCAPLGAAVHYAVKANGNLAVLRLISNAGLGFDAASAGEIGRVRAAGGDIARTIFTGPGKTSAEIGCAAAAGLAAIVCESTDELRRVEDYARSLGRTVRIGVRVNPGVMAGAHPHIATGMSNTKFGASAAEAVHMLGIAHSSGHLEPVSVNAHIGSQISASAPYIETARLLFDLADRVQERCGTRLKIDLGGGFAIGDTADGESPDVLGELTAWLAKNAGNRQLAFEPGRLLIGRAGVLLARVEYVRRRHIVVDAGMNDLPRPALYNASHPVAKVGGAVAGKGDMEIVGPVCETADFLARSVDMDAAPGDLLAICNAGAYCFSMSSNYNGRGRACEVIADGGNAELARRRESLADMLAPELENKDSVALTRAQE